MLHAAALGLSFLGGSAIAARPKRRALLSIWLEGGVSQLETWDPHPGSAIGGQATAIATSVPGLKIAGLYPQLAPQLHHLSVIRSLVSKEGDHERGTYTLKTGHRPEAGVVHPSLGALAAYLAPREGLALPAHLSLGKSQWPARGGMLGADFDAFKIASPGEHIDNLEAPAPAREERRLSTLKTVSAAFAAGHPGVEPRLRHQATVDAALAMMRSEELAAFKLDDEPAAVRSAYGESTFGRGCLVARRLLERGVSAVEVTLSGFDSHTSNHEAHRERAQALDPALATLISELATRGLLETTVLLCSSEFGRTPKLNAAEGRDHWPHGFSCLLGGGALRAGVVIGETDPSGAKREPADPVGVDQLAATLLRGLGHDPSQELESPEGRPVTLSKGAPLGRLL